MGEYLKGGEDKDKDFLIVLGIVMRWSDAEIADYFIRGALIEGLSTEQIQSFFYNPIVLDHSGITPIEKAKSNASAASFILCSVFINEGLRGLKELREEWKTAIESQVK